MRGECVVIVLDRGGCDGRGQPGVAARAGGLGSHSARLNERVLDRGTSSQVPACAQHEGVGHLSVGCRAPMACSAARGDCQ